MMHSARAFDQLFHTARQQQKFSQRALSKKVLEMISAHAQQIALYQEVK